jgi:hypothetical protein
MDSLLTHLRARLKPRSTRMPEGPREHVQLTNPWHAISIVAGGQCCAEAIALAGRRFLTRSSDREHERPPPLPLPGCQAHSCRCRYQHHPDRRRAGQGRSPTTPTSRPQRRSEDTPREAPAGR